MITNRDLNLDPSNVPTPSRNGKKKGKGERQKEKGQKKKRKAESSLDHPLESPRVRSGVWFAAFFGLVRLGLSFLLAEGSCPFI
jgi:hypothetical protein